MQRLNFFIVGAQKAGTTALSVYLRRAPQVQIPALKEIHFFNDDARDWDNPDYNDLTRHFSWAPDAPPIRGEATPAYIYWPNALERLRRYNADAKLIVCLRHPAFRAYSHWRMETKRGDESLPFEIAISEIGRRRLNETGNRAHLHYSYVERGFYGRQIARLLELFPRERLLFLETDEMWSEPDRVMRRVHDFLGLAPPDPVEKEYIVPVETRDVGPMSDATRDALTDLYREDILQAAQLTGLPLERWLSPAYVETTPRPFGVEPGAFPVEMDPLAEERAFEALDKTLVAAAERAEKQEEWVKAAFFASDLRKYFPDLETGYRVGAASARNLGRWDEAIAILDEGEQRFPDQAWVSVERARLARSRGDLAEADRLAGALRAYYPDLAAGYEIGAATVRELGRIEEAISILGVASDRFPGAPWLKTQLAWTARAQGALDAAISYAEEVRAEFPDDSDGYYSVAVFLRAQNRLCEALDILREAASRFPAKTWFAEEATRLAALIDNREATARLAGRLADASGRLIEHARRPLFGPKVVVVLGMHRAGTSLCAKVAEGLGVGLGGPLFAADFANSDGYREHKAIVACHEELLALSGVQWDAVRFSGIDEAFFRRPDVRAVRERLTRIVSDELAANGDAWAFKDPRTARFIPLWREIFDEVGVAPVWLLSVRDPGAVAASLAKRDGLPRTMGEMLWLEHYLEVLRLLGPQLDAVLHYERWFSPAGEGQLARLAALVDAPAAALETARGAIHAKLRHQAPGETRGLDLAQQVHAWLAPANPDLRLLQREAEILWKDIGKIKTSLS
ncbi:tetratricopeptide repeat protein [Methylocystis parvus]|uniref:tetratricopeptide repeat protein n=1 Tax=Methylocystis parvus TaxID=134 RepID=UPI003C729DCE